MLNIDGNSYTMLVGKPPFQTKDLKAIYKKIKSLDYEFPSHVIVAEQAVDLIQAILDREPQNRPSASEILSHEFQHCGPFPRTIPASATETAPDFSHLSTLQSSRNYAYVQKMTGASLSTSADSMSTPTIPEEDAVTTETTQPPEPPAQVVALSSGLNVSAQEMAIEKEVKKVLEPGSPISELLKSARKPLMVSPRALAAQREREKNEIARQAVSGSAAQRQLSEKENLAAETRRTTRSQEKKAAVADVKEGETGLEVAVRALRVTSGIPTSPNRMTSTTTSLTAANGKDKRKMATSASPSIIVAGEPENDGRMVLSAREAYEACFKTLDLAIAGNRRALHLQGKYGTAWPGLIQAYEAFLHTAQKQR